MAKWIARLLAALRPTPRQEDSRPSSWRLGVPLVCLLAGLLLGATHGVSRGGEIRRSDAPRLVEMGEPPRFRISTKGWSRRRSMRARAVST